MRYLAFFGFFVFLFFISRIYRLQFIPIFVDEAIYVNWALLGFQDASLRLISLIDGKQPLYIWIVSIVLNIIHNPLIAGRIVSTLAGFITAVGLFLLSLELFKNKKIALISAFLYTLYPFALVLNRMALYESLVGAFAVWGLYLVILLVRYTQSGFAFLLGFVLGGGLLTKSSGFISLLLFPSAFFLFPHKGKESLRKLFLLISYYFIACLVGFLFYSVLLLSDKFYMIAEKNSVFVYHVSELLPYNALGKWVPQLLQLISWAALYLTYPLFIIIFLSLLNVKFRKEKLILLLNFLVPLIGFALFDRILNSRYIFAITLFLLPLGALGIHEFCIKYRKIIPVIFLLIFSFLIYSDFKIISDMSHAPIPKEDLQQYVNGTTSGVGLREIIGYLMSIASKESIVIATEGIYGSLPTTVVKTYFLNYPQVEIEPFEKMSKNLPLSLLEKSKNKPVYVILNETQSVSNWPLKLIMKYKRGVSNYFMGLYQVL